MKIVFLAGAPGSGKSTQGQALMGMNKAITHLSLGEVVRSIIKNPEHPITIKYHALISSGSLLPDEVIFEILENELAKINDEKQIVLLDGFPRTKAQYQQFKSKWGMPAGLIHLDVDEQTLRSRLQNRESSRCDDNEKAIEKRLDFYQTTTKPLLKSIKEELKKNTVIVPAGDSISGTSIYLYAKLQRISELHELLTANLSEKNTQVTTNSIVKPVWAYSVFSQLWQTGSEYAAVDKIQKGYETKNFMFSMLGKKIVYLETKNEVKTVLEARSDLGPVYRHFSIAAGLKHDFVATASHDSTSYWQVDNQINMWKLVHDAFANVLKSERDRIESLMDKHLDNVFFAEKDFDLDTTFDLFFCSFWSEYLFGNQVSVSQYMENREHLLTAMKHCFYNNNYKGLDPSGLSSFFYSLTVQRDLKLAKENIKTFIHKSMPGSLVHRLKEALSEINSRENLNLSDEIIDEVMADNVFDLIFEPDFLENVMYETVASAIRENADLHETKTRNYVYEQGMRKGYLFPMRSRVLEESVTLADGSVLPAGTMVYLNLLKAGLYHSVGARRCVGQAYTHYFRDHLFKRLEGVEFKVKGITYPEGRKSSENVPVSPERYQVSWRLKRDEAMRYLPAHNYRGANFFDVLSLHQNAGLNTQMVKQCVFKINRFLQKNNLELKDVVIATPEVRGVPIAAQVAYQLHLPLYVIRKKGGYKISAEEVYIETYCKGYGDVDAVELPISKVKEMTGKAVVFLDDGIASGESAMACVKLLEGHCDSVKAPRVPLVLTLLKHDYTPITPKLSEHSLVKTLFDCRSKVSKPAVSQESIDTCKKCSLDEGHRP